MIIIDMMKLLYCVVFTWSGTQAQYVALKDCKRLQLYNTVNIIRRPWIRQYNTINNTN